MQKVKVAFLDRDGTINVDRGFVHRIKDWEFVPSACDALKLLSQAGFRIAIVTNQSGVAAGLYTIEDLERLHSFMRQQLSQAGIHLDAVVYCPHSREANCDCRKPLPGLGRRVEVVLQAPIDYSASWMIGDKPSDVEFGRSLGMKTALIRSRYWSEPGDPSAADLITDSLFDAVQRIVGMANL